MVYLRSVRQWRFWGVSAHTYALCEVQLGYQRRSKGGLLIFGPVAICNGLCSPVQPQPHSRPLTGHNDKRERSAADQQPISDRGAGAYRYLL